MMNPATITLIILAITAIFFITEFIPVPLSAMLCATALMLLKIVEPSDVIAGFGNSNVIIIVTMTVVGGALFETGITGKITRGALKIAKTEKQMALAIFLIGAVLSAGLNNTGTMAMMVPLILGIQASVGYSASKLMMSGLLGVLCGGRLTLIGDATVNSIAKSAIESVGGTFGFLDIGRIGLPVTIITALWLYFWGYDHMPKHKVNTENAVFSEDEVKDVPKWQQIASIVIILSVFFGMAFQKQLGMPLYEISLIGAVAVCGLRILKGKQFYNLIDMKTVLLYVGMLPLGTAMSTTGAAQLIADGVSYLVGGTGNVYLIVALVFIVTCFMTQFTSNVVTINLLAPVLLALAVNLNVNPVSLIITAATAASCGYVSPVSCPPATIIYGNGGFKFSDYIKSNWTILLITFVMCVVLLPSIFSF